MTTGCWRSISHAHNREDSLLSHTSLRTDGLTAGCLQGHYCCFCLQQKGLPVRQLGRSHLWPKHGSQRYLCWFKLEGCLCSKLLLLGCLLVYISTCCCPEGRMHISLVMSVRMLTLDSCSSELAYCSSDQLRVPTAWYIMHLRYSCMHRKDAMNSV